MSPTRPFRWGKSPPIRPALSIAAGSASGPVNSGGLRADDLINISARSDRLYWDADPPTLAPEAEPGGREAGSGFGLGQEELCAVLNERFSLNPIHQMPGLNT